MSNQSKTQLKEWEEQGYHVLNVRTTVSKPYLHKKSGEIRTNGEKSPSVFGFIDKVTGVFTKSFVDYITKNNPGVFPRFLVDTDVNLVRKEVISYYYNLFPHTEAYRSYTLTELEKDEVKI